MLNTLDDLESFFKLCRKQGVETIKLENIEVKFGDMPSKQRKSLEASSSDEIPTDGPTPEELLFYAVREPGIT